jgi:hypothetical protein
MRKLVAVVLATALIIGVMAPAARAGSSTDIALGLAAFAVFNQIVTPLLHPRPAYAVPVIRDHHPAVYSTRTVYVVPYHQRVVVTYPVAPPPPPPPMPTVVQYPHGRHELRGDGVTTAYHWVWIPNPPPPPPAPPPAP